jgi:hypothetical protein
MEVFTTQNLVALISILQDTSHSPRQLWWYTGNNLDLKSGSACLEECLLCYRLSWLSSLFFQSSQALIPVSKSCKIYCEL